MPNKAVQLVQLLRSTKREKRLGTVILFVTSRCNAACQTCFYHEELNQPGDMTFAQIEKVSRTMPPITDLWLSGGEPTLRRDLSDVIDLFVTNNGVDRIIIPTNGLIKSRVYDVVDRALGNNPQIDLYLNIALDGYGQTHDRIRGVPGNWTKALDCIESLYPLKTKYTDRFRLNVNTVVCAENYTEIEMLAEFMWANYRLDGQYFNIIRGETLVGEEIKQVPPEVLPEMYARVAKLTKRYGDRMFADDDASKRFVKNVAYVGTITTHYRTQHANFNQSTPWPFPCTAGETTAVIDYNGDVRASCVRSSRRWRILITTSVRCGRHSREPTSSRRSMAAKRAGVRTSVSFTTPCVTRAVRCSTKCRKTFSPARAGKTIHRLHRLPTESV